jgi:hypothetical protein
LHCKTIGLESKLIAPTGTLYADRDAEVRVLQSKSIIENGHTLTIVRVTDDTTEAWLPVDMLDSE